MMNLFARALGGFVSDRCNRRWGLRGRARLLGFTIAAEGLAMLLFSHIHVLPLAIASMMFTGLFVKMSNGANYSIVPFVNKRAVGAVAGIVGAGGNLGAVLAGFLCKIPSLTYPQAFTILGVLILLCSVGAFAVRFSDTDEIASKEEMAARRGAADGLRFSRLQPEQIDDSMLCFFILATLAWAVSETGGLRIVRNSRFGSCCRCSGRSSGSSNPAVLARNGVGQHQPHIEDASLLRAKPERLPSTRRIETTAALKKRPLSRSSCRGASDTVLGVRVNRDCRGVRRPNE